MNQETVKRIRIFPLWKMEEENRWLSEMAKQGWMLSSVRGITYSFHAEEPSETVFFHELRGIAGKTDRQTVEDFAEFGWRHIARTAAYDYFASDPDNKHLQMYQDSVTVKKRVTMMLFLNAVAFFNLLTILMMSTKGFFADFAPFGFGFLVIALGLIPLLIYSSIRLLGMLRKLRQDIRQ